MKTLILGASTNPGRYAYRAAEMLHQNGYDFVPVGIKKGEVLGRPILSGKPALQDIHTVTLYIGPRNQDEWIDYVLQLNPKRLIFNPGTENPDFMKRASSEGIDVLPACTLVMLATNTYGS